MLALLAAVRFVHFTDLALLFGVAAFPFYARLPGEGAEPPSVLARALGVTAAVTTALVLGMAPATVAGDLTVVVRLRTLWEAESGTAFGQVWLLRLFLAIYLAVISFRQKPWDRRLAITAGVLLVSIALAGHSRIPDGLLAVVHVLADAVHLLAAGAWIGGLFALILALRLRRMGREGTAGSVLRGFGKMVYAAVIALAVTGLIKSVLLIGTPAGLFTAYGVVLLVKLLLFLGMVALAVRSRYTITPGLEDNPGDPAPLLAQLRRQVRVEFALGVLILAAVALLGHLQPPASL
jgi:putative copper resistance protein D